MMRKQIPHVDDVFNFFVVYCNSICMEEVYELLEHADQTNTTEHDIIPPKIMKIGSDKLGFTISNLIKPFCCSFSQSFD